MHNIVQFPGSKGQAAPVKKPNRQPVLGVPLTKVGEAIQAVMFLENDLPAAEELLAAFAQAVREGRREVNVTTPLALGYSRYFCYRDPEWEAAHSDMYELCIGLK